MVSRHQKNFFLVFNTLICLLVIVLIVRGPASKHAVQHTETLPLELPKIITTQTKEVIPEIPTLPEKPVTPELFEYIKIIDGCGSHFQGSCVNVRTAPSNRAPVAYKLRNGTVLRVHDMVTVEGKNWYKVYFDEWLRYPERVKPNLYVAAEFVTPFFDEGGKVATTGTSTKKYIIVDRSKQLLYAYDDGVLFMKEKISTGINLTPTPRGTFTIYKKTPSRYMQGPISGISNHYYDLPGVPWNLYFSIDGAVIHGAYWHDSFGKKWSNGCVNLPVESAEKLYKWAEVGTTVVVRD